MRLCMLILDDDLQTLYNPLHTIFNPMLKDGVIPLLTGGTSTIFRIDGFGEKGLEVEITSNSQNDPERITKEINADYRTLKYDIVLVDDNWGQWGTIAGQSQLLPAALSAITGVCPELPVFVLFTEHWEQTDRVKMFCDLMNRYPTEQRRVTGLHKNDTSGLMLLIQRVVAEKRMEEERHRLAEENTRLRKESIEYYRPDNMVGESPEIREVYRMVSLVAKGPTTVLVRGESGTGKELVAEAIRQKSDRRDGAFVKVNCAQLSESVLESELFGHEAGSFTGARTSRIGRFEAASGGTIFLDEIGDFSPSTQIRLLRVLQEKQIERVGSNRPIDVDVRVIAATHRNLEEMILQGQFRQDLYYRLSKFEIYIPPLRNRCTDIPLLVQHFVETISANIERQAAEVSPKAIQAMSAYQWPGNVRELQNCIERALILCQGNLIEVEHLSSAVLATMQSDVGDLNPHVEIEIKKRLDVILQLSKGGRSRITNSMIDEAMGNQAGAFKVYCRDNGQEIVRVVLADIQKYRPIIEVLRRLSPTNFAQLPTSE